MKPTRSGARPINRTSTRLAVVLVLFVVCRCTGWMATKIEDIRNNPRQYAGKEVTVSGEVTNTFSLVVVKYFTLRDKTGEITVVTHKPLPKQGDRIRVTGVVRETFSIGSKSLLVIVEEAEKAKK